MGDGSLDALIERHAAALGRQRHPNARAQDDIAALRKVLDIAEELEDKLQKYNLKSDEHKKALRKPLEELLPKITLQTRDVFRAYTMIETIGEEQYAALTNDDGSGTTPIITIGNLVADVDARLRNIYDLISPYFSGQKSLNKLSEFWKELVGEKFQFNNAEARHQFIAYTRVVKRLEDNRTAYHAERGDIAARVDAFEGKVRVLTESKDADEVISLAAHWSVGDAQEDNSAYKATIADEYKDAEKRVKETRRLTQHERTAFEKRLKHVRQALEFSLPARTAWLEEIIGNRIQEDLSQYPTLITVTETGVTDTSEDVLQRFWTMKSAYDHLTQKEVRALTRVGDHKEGAGIESGTNLGVSTLITSAEQQMQFLKSEREPLRYLASIVAGQRNIFEGSTLDDLAKIYGRRSEGLFLNPSWQNRTSYPGTYAIAEALRQQTLETLARTFSEAAETQRLVEEQHVLHSGQLPLETLNRTRTLHGIVTKVTQEAEKYDADLNVKRQNDEKERSALGNEKKREKTYALNLYQLIVRMPEFKALRESLEPNAALRDARDRIRNIGREGFMGTGRSSVAYSSVLNTYEQFERVLEEHVANLLPHVRETPVIREVVATQREKLKHMLLSRADTLGNLLGVEIERASRTDLEAQVTALNRIIEISREAGRKTARYEQERAKYLALAQRSGQIITVEREHLPVFVLDTNILLSDEGAIRYFSNRGYVVIANEVLQELDHLKTKEGDVGYLARRTNQLLNDLGLREPDERSIDSGRRGIFRDRLGMFIRKERVILYDRNGNLREKALRMEPGNRYELRLDRMQSGFSSNPDEYIRRAAQHLAIEHERSSWLRQVPSWLHHAEKIVFVTNDVVSGLLGATRLRIADHLMHSALRNLNDFYTGYRFVDLPEELQREVASRNFTQGMLDNVLEIARDAGRWTNAEGKSLAIKTALTENEFVFCPDPAQRANTRILRYSNGTLQPLHSLPEEAREFPLRWLQEHPDTRLLPGITVCDEEQIAAYDLFMDPAIELLTIQGVGGTGKTKFAVSASAELMRTQESRFKTRLYDNIKYTMPNTQVDKSNVGALPGGLIEKQRPWIEQFNAFLEEIQPYTGRIEPEVNPLAYMRGRDLKGIRIVDECQNTWPFEMKTIITRHSDPAKTVLLGDPEQVDTRAGRDHGFAHVRLAFPGQDNYGHVTFTNSRRGRMARQGSTLLPYRGGA